MTDDRLNQDANKPLDKIDSTYTLESDLTSAVMNSNYSSNIIKNVVDPKKNSIFNKEKEIEEKAIDPVEIKVSRSKYTFIAASIIFLVLSVGIVLYIIYKTQNVNINNLGENNTGFLNKENLPDETIPVVKYNDVLNPEIIKSADFTLLGREQIILEINKIKKLLVDNKITPSNNVGIDTGLDVRKLFEKIQYSGEESLFRSFGNTYAFGIYSNEKSELETYLLIEIVNFDLAFKSMLGWERFAPIDLKGIFVGNNEITNYSTTTSTSTLTEKRYRKADTKIFLDRVLKNYDVREYVDNLNNVDIVYGFINNKFLLLTSGESSFLDIKNRLLKENISR